MRFMKLRNKFYFKRQDAAPPSVDGGNTASPGGGSSASAVAETVAPSIVDGVDVKSGEDVALRSQLKEAANAWKDKFAPKEEPGEPPAPIEPGKTPLHDVAAMSKPTEDIPLPKDAATTPEEAKTLPAEKPAETPVEEAVKAPEITPETVIKLGSDEYKPQELESIIDFAKKADAYLKTEKSTFDARVAQLKSQETSFAEREAKIQERLSSPDLVLLETLANNPELRDKFYQMACEADPEIEGKYNHAKSSQTIEQLQKKIEALENGFSSRVKQEEQTYQQYQQKLAQAEAQRVGSEIANFEQEQIKAHGIDPVYARMINSDAAELIRQGKLDRSLPAVKQYLTAQYQKVSTDFKAREERARNAYLKEKQGNPPPPPTGGGPTRVSPARPRTFADAESALESRINALKS